MTRQPATSTRPRLKKAPAPAINTVLMSHDTGTTNYGFAVWKVQANANSSGEPTLRLKLLHRGMVWTVVRDLKGRSPTDEILEYLAWITSIEDQYDVRAHIAERYMARNTSRSTVIEAVSLMLGGLALHCAQTKKAFKVIPASEWKNEVRRAGVDLEAAYARAKGNKVEPHEVDAALIGVYGAHKLARIRAFTQLQTSTNRAEWEKVLTLTGLRYGAKPLTKGQIKQRKQVAKRKVAREKARAAKLKAKAKGKRQ